MIYNNILETIGNAPFVKINNFDEKNRAQMYIQLLYFNPGGSIKDSVAYHMITEMEKDGSLKEGSTIIEATSGNTGIGVAMVAIVKGYKTIIVMPETASKERIMLLKAYGVEVILTTGKEGMLGSITLAKKLAKEKNYTLLSQFENKYNPQSHEKTVETELLKNFPNLSAFISSVGTGGTITGTATVLKRKSPQTRIIAVEPKNSAVLSGGKAGVHKLQGIGTGILQKNTQVELIDQIITVTDDEAIQHARLMARNNGILLGFSGGAEFCAALQIARELSCEDTVVFHAPDNGERYLSTDLYK